MPESSIQVEYNRNLSGLAKVLAKVNRPGDFYASGLLEAPMPRLEIEGVGALFFPVPEGQARQVIAQAERAPYGRGDETIVDPAVRKVWQLSPEKVRLTGRSWGETFGRILADVAKGLGVPREAVAAELYKLLVYDQGGFFLPHRDTEKVAGMFGTLVVVLPSAHRGGELIIRHARREAALDLCPEEPSQLTYAAFYADCEHEVRPVTEGNRVCLIYNLIQPVRGKARQQILRAPDYESEAAAAAKILSGWAKSGDAPPKLVYLLEHQYSPANLSWVGLKNADAALGKTFAQAAERAGCAVHLGIVHIEESGPAEPQWDPYYDRRSRWRRGYDDEDEDSTTSEEFEIIEISESTQHINEWKNLDDQAIEFGEIPLEPGELLPEGALDGEPPDEQRVTEATGNEGASFERSYHRAAIIVWPTNRYAEVLLQGGVGSALPYFQERIKAWSRSKSAEKARLGEEVVGLARRMVAAWPTTPHPYRSWSLRPDPTLRVRMLGALRKVGDAALVRHFIEGVLLPAYDGSESAALVASGPILGAQITGELLARIVENHLPKSPAACIDLLSRVVTAHGGASKPDWRAAAELVARAVVAALPRIQARTKSAAFAAWEVDSGKNSLNAASLGLLLDTLRALDCPGLSEQVVEILAADTSTFPPDELLAPVLVRRGERSRQAISSDPHLTRLWRHTVEFLLGRSGVPPEPPQDWAQPVKLRCRCEDCRALEKFAKDAAARVARFPLRKDRRQHLHRTIEQHNLDMTHVTERKGSPQTLVCTKTRRAFQKRCEQYRHDIEHLRGLGQLMETPSARKPALLSRLNEAVARAG